METADPTVAPPPGATTTATPETRQLTLRWLLSQVSCGHQGRERGEQSRGRRGRACELPFRQVWEVHALEARAADPVSLVYTLGGLCSLGMVDVYAELVAVIRALEEAQIDYALCGALALAVHGAPRATKDIDLIARREDAERIRETVRRIGFTFEALPMEFANSGIEVQRFTKLVEGRPLMLDVMWLSPKLQAIWDDRQRVAWDEGELSVVSRDGLITLKLTAGRAQDLVDIQSLTAAEGNRDKT